MLLSQRAWSPTCASFIASPCSRLTCSYLCVLPVTNVLPYAWLFTKYGWNVLLPLFFGFQITDPSTSTIKSSSPISSLTDEDLSLLRSLVLVSYEFKLLYLLSWVICTVPGLPLLLSNACSPFFSCLPFFIYFQMLSFPLLVSLGLSILLAVGLCVLNCRVAAASRACSPSFPSAGPTLPMMLSLIHIWRCRRSTLCRSRWSPYH